MIQQYIYHIFLTFFLFEKLSNSILGSNFLLSSESINIVPYSAFITLLKSLYCCKTYMIYLISFSKFSDSLPHFTFANAIRNL